MAGTKKLELLAPNTSDGHHDLRDVRVVGKLIELGKAKFMDAITDSVLVDCDILINCGANSLILGRSTFERCAFYPKREMKNLRLTSVNLQDCIFSGKYSGCRFGSDLEEVKVDIKGCDFSGAKIFHLCDFLVGSHVDTFKWPAWPHIIIKDLPHSGKYWNTLRLPEEMRIVQNVIGAPESPSLAVSIYLPSVTTKSEELRELLASQSYIHGAT